ncbi:MAG: MFS transporter [Armatimonadetes bacterium]|nr:MFS transporter [Armatimonadota bacterium]
MTEEQTSAPPSGGLSRLQIRRALRLWTWEASAATVQITLTQGAFQTGFALYLGCSDFVIGILAAIPAFAGLLQLVTSYFAQRGGSRRLIVAWSAFASRLLWVPMLLIPFLLPRPLWVGTFLILILLSSALANVAQPLWTAWISDLVPEDSRGRYFGRRNMYAGLVGMVVSVVGGWYLDAATKGQGHGDPRAAFAVLFGLATVAALGSFGCGMSSPDVPPAARREGAGTGGLRDALAFYAAPFADRNFRRFMLFYATLVLAQTVAGQFFLVYQFKTLVLNYTAVQALGAVASLTSLASMPLWGYLTDKYGNKPILMISVALVILPPFQWLLTYPDGIPGLWMHGAHGALLISYTKVNIILLNLAAGAGWAGVGLTQFNLMLGAAEAERRTVYVSAISAVAGLAGGVGPLLGGAILTALAPVHFPQSGLIRGNYHVLFVLSGLLRFASLLLLQPLEEAGSRGARYVLRQLKATKPVGSLANIRRLSKGDSAQTRQQAAENLARLKTPVAVEELVKALDDVARSVREQAAVALGEIGDARATGPLVRKLTDPSSGITPAAATALGKIGDKAALPPLAAAAQLGPPPRQLAALEALGHLPDPRVTDVLLGVLGDRDPSVRTAAIRALAEREEPRSAPALAARFAQERDPASLAALADALGRVGDPSQACALIDALDRTPSPTVRRETLNAIGSLLGGRDAFYPYLVLDADARDETVSKILTTIQRRYRARAAQQVPGAARVAARARQAMASYARGDLSACLHRLTQLMRMLGGGDAARQPAVACLEALQARGERTGEPPTPEEVLLAVFLVRQMAEA